MNDVNTVLKTIMKDHKVTQADIARAFGISNQAVFNRFNSGSWKIDEVIKILALADCRLVVESGEIRRYIF